MSKAKELIKFIEAKVGLHDDKEIRLWILNDEGLYNWAREEGVEEGDFSSDNPKFMAFVNKHRKEIVNAINQQLGR